MSNSKRALSSRLFRAIRAFFEPLSMQVLPLSSSQRIEANKSEIITGRVNNTGFWPERLIIGSSATPGGAADWAVNDLKSGGKSLFSQSGDIPGDMFTTNSTHGFVTFKPVKPNTLVEIIVTYIGLNPEGCAFQCAMLGMEYDPGLMELAREALSAGFTALAEGLSARPR